jgi:hypothetical protein
MIRFQKFISRKDLQNDPESLYVFGDNMTERGLGGQAKEMRGEPNAVGIPTKIYPGNEDFDFFKDSDFNRAKVRIDAAFMKLFVHAAHGGLIVWPEDGIGTGLADLENKAPKIWAFIEDYFIALNKI